jgi:hypothetical protein
MFRIKNKKIRLRIAVFCAKHAIKYFLAVTPKDKRPQRAINIAESYLSHHNLFVSYDVAKKTAQAANDAAYDIGLRGYVPAEYKKRIKNKKDPHIVTVEESRARSAALVACHVAESVAILLATNPDDIAAIDASYKIYANHKDKAFHFATTCATKMAVCLTRETKEWLFWFLAHKILSSRRRRFLQTPL